jgi:hypothetical protein
MKAVCDAEGAATQKEGSFELDAWADGALRFQPAPTTD